MYLSASGRTESILNRITAAEAPRVMLSSQAPGVSHSNRSRRLSPHVRLSLRHVLNDHPRSCSRLSAVRSHDPLCPRWPPPLPNSIRYIRSNQNQQASVPRSAAQCICLERANQSSRVIGQTPQIGDIAESHPVDQIAISCLRIPTHPLSTLSPPPPPGPRRIATTPFSTSQPLM